MRVHGLTDGWGSRSSTRLSLALELDLKYAMDKKVGDPVRMPATAHLNCASEMVERGGLTCL